MKKLHGTAVERDGSWKSLPPHVPGNCYGANGSQCPSPPDEPCKHAHRSIRNALTCSYKREPFNTQRKTR
jgi:hypothetical protein